MDKPSGSKPFDIVLYGRNDPKAKKEGCEFLVSIGKYTLGIPIEKQGEHYQRGDVILIRIEDGVEVGMEAERKEVWKKSGMWETANWDTVDVPFRKHTSEAKIFIMFNEAWDTLAITQMETILKKDKNGKFKFKGWKKETTYTKDEPFFKVPLMCWRFFKRDEENPEKWVEITYNGELV